MGGDLLLVIAGSVGVFLLYLYVLRHWPASRATYAFVLIPFVTVLLSSWLDDEPVGAGLVLGGLLVLAGVYVGALRPPEREPAPAASAVIGPPGGEADRSRDGTPLSPDRDTSRRPERPGRATGGG